MEFKYFFHLIIFFFGLLNASNARPQKSSSAITTCERKYDVNKYGSDDFNVLEYFIGDVTPQGLLFISGGRNDDTSEDIISREISTVRYFKDASDNEISELYSTKNIHIKNVRSPSHNPMTNALQTEAGITPLSYFGRAKRSTQPLSDLIQNTTVHVIRECPDCYYIVDILRAIAKANGLTFEELFNKIESFDTDQENRTAKLTAEPNSDYSGSVALNYYF